MPPLPWTVADGCQKLEEARCKTNKNASASCEDAHKSALSKMRQACLGAWSVNVWTSADLRTTETEEVVKYVEMQEGEMDKA